MKKIWKKIAAALIAAVMFFALPGAQVLAAEPTQAEVQAVIDQVAALDPAAPQCLITYDFGGGKTYTIGPEMAMSMMIKNDDGSYYIDPNTGYYVLDAVKMIGFFTSLSQQIDITSSTLTFRTTGGETKTFTNTSYKKRVIDPVEEMKYLPDAIMKGAHETRTPALTYDNTYVEVDLDNQHAYYYQNGELKWSSDIVSGNTSKDNGTPTGVYAIDKYMTRNTYLIGEDYKSFVNYWMPFIGNSVGLHDATWRSYFGGSIYKTSGSHGCVNLPLLKAAQLYDLVSVGTPVIVY